MHLVIQELVVQYVDLLPIHVQVVLLLDILQGYVDDHNHGLVQVDHPLHVACQIQVVPPVISHGDDLLLMVHQLMHMLQIQFLVDQAVVVK